MSHNPLRNRDKRSAERYLLVFLLGFGAMLFVLLPLILFDQGYFLYYGDFNSQQLPFYQLAHDAVQNGEFGWNWQTDLGSNFIGSYAFYLLGSPFFWLTTLFPSKAVLYLIPYLLCLKHACATLTAYAFIRRFVRSKRAAFIGALAYAFSGFQLYNIFFNHFQDVTAFFPLLLIALEERVNANRRGVFALAVALMAVINYFFFTGQVVFVLLYFLFRCFCKDFHITWKTFFWIAAEAVLGVLLAAGMLLPAALAILGNGRITEHLFGIDMAVYSEPTRILRIVQTFFMLPDAPARPNLFDSNSAKWASIGGYLPLFGMVGVIGFWKKRRTHWASLLTATCALFAMIPILNASFYAFNGSYYARWFYMPILILALMSAMALDDPKISLRPGIWMSGIALALFGAIACLPTKDKDGTLHFFAIAKQPVYFLIQWVICVIALVYVGFLWYRKKRGHAFLSRAVVAMVAAVVVCTASSVYFGASLGVFPSTYIQTAIRGGERVTLPDPEEQFYRLDISESYDNYPMFWGYSNMRCFQSIVPSSIMDFYEQVGVTRDVASRATVDHYTLRGLFSVRYYFDKVESEKASEYTYDIGMPGFVYREIQNGFYVYENEEYLPMGLAYDRYLVDTDLENRSAMSRERQLIHAVVLTEEQAEKYADILAPATPETGAINTEADYLKGCEERRENACTDFSYDSDGFCAKITREDPALVFFSVPYEKGWTATVNGEAADVERVSYGFLAVPVAAGESVIEFHYETDGLRTGLFLSLGGLVLLIGYLAAGYCWDRRHGKSRAGHVHFYDYETPVALTTRAQYEENLIRQRKRRPVKEQQKEESEHASDGGNAAE